MKFTPRVDRNGLPVLAEKSPIFSPSQRIDPLSSAQEPEPPTMEAVPPRTSQKRCPRCGARGFIVKRLAGGASYKCRQCRQGTWTEATQ